MKSFIITSAILLSLVSHPSWSDTAIAPKALWDCKPEASGKLRLERTYRNKTYYEYEDDSTLVDLLYVKLYADKLVLEWVSGTFGRHAKEYKLVKRKFERGTNFSRKDFSTFPNGRGFFMSSQRTDKGDGYVSNQYIILNGTKLKMYQSFVASGTALEDNFDASTFKCHKMY